MCRGAPLGTVPGRCVAAPAPDRDVVSPGRANGVDGPDRSGVDGHQLDAKRQRLRSILGDRNRPTSPRSDLPGHVLFLITLRELRGDCHENQGHYQVSKW